MFRISGTQLRAAFPALAHTVYLDTAGASGGSTMPAEADGNVPFGETDAERDASAP